MERTWDETLTFFFGLKFNWKIMAKFRYDQTITNESTIQINIESNVNKFVRLDGIYIPNDVIILIQYFYGLTYKIYGNKPNNDEIDYVLHLLKPINKMGFILSKRLPNAVIKVTLPYAQQNIVLLSRIIQINNIYIKNGTMNSKYIFDMIKHAKQNTPSFIVFRCKTKYTIKGFHIQFDVTNKNDNNEFFPYFKFNKYALNDVCSAYKSLEIMDVYANKKCINNKYGVSIYMFIKNSMEYNITHIIHDLKHKISKIDTNIQCIYVRKEFNSKLCFFFEQTNSYSIKAGFGPLKSLNFFINGGNGKSVKKYWCSVMVNQCKSFEFRKLINKSKFNDMTLDDIKKHGHIIASKEGFHSSDHGWRQQFSVPEKKILMRIRNYFQYGIQKILAEFADFC